MSIEHLVIPDAQRHEPKGASTALINQVHMSNGDTTTKWSLVDYTTLNNKPTLSGYLPAVSGFSTAVSQLPSAVDTALQVEFGSLQTTTDVTLSALGLITFNTTGQYIVEATLRFGRTTATGSAIMFSRVKINGSQSGSSNAITLVDTALVIPYKHFHIYNATAGDTMALEIHRGSAGINNGGLYQTVPVLGGWNSSPSAVVTVSKFKGFN